MRIGQLAEITGISRDTIRYYEKIGLLPRPRRRESGYREYPDEAGNRIRVIRNAVQLGFPLKEIAKVLNVRDAGGAPCRQVRDYAHSLVGEIDQKIDHLQLQRRAMLDVIRQWDARLAQTAPGQRAHLLEHDGSIVEHGAPRQHTLRRKQR
jgi:DNA-binding transcriptional MerR regulator